MTRTKKKSTEAAVILRLVRDFEMLPPLPRPFN
jgi:hypothetical protein